LGLGGRHPIEKVGERWCGGRESSVGPMLKALLASVIPALEADKLVLWKNS
jgi:hypothetical protein